MMPEVAWYIYLMAAAAGVLAGIINTVAGSGSLVTLPLLMFLGLPADVANGTNRVGVILQNVVGILAYRRATNIPVAGAPWLVVPSVVGSLVGAVLAAFLDGESTEVVIGIVMVAMLFVILIKPKQWLRETSEPAVGRPSLLTLVGFFAIGVYGGFIMAGVGVLLLAGLVLGGGYSINHANMIKLVIVLLTTLFVLPVFAWNGTIDWPMGILLTIGQSVGAWLAATYATRVPNANLWIRRLLIVIVLIGITDFLL